jgi:hypothetical protein
MHSYKSPFQRRSMPDLHGISPTERSKDICPLFKKNSYLW